MQAILELEEAHKTYPGIVPTPALLPTTLAFRPRELVAIAGPSGSGKTTLLNLVGGLDRPSGGKIRAFGLDLGSLSDARLSEYRRRYLGFVFQFFNLVESLTILENIRLAKELARSDANLDDLLEKVGLPDKGDRFPAELSAGQQQRAAIARALAKKAPLLLCDEPTGALDQESGKLVLALLLDAADRLDCTVIVVTHNTPITRLMDRVIRLRDGRIVEDSANPCRASLKEMVW